MKQTLKKIYNYIPFKKEIFLALKTMYTPSESVYKHLHFKGVINVKVNANTSFKMNHYGFQIENEIFWQGLEDGWEKRSISLWISLAKDAGSIMDIGANTGIFALVAKAVQSSAKVYAFEPILRVHEKLQDNIALNKFDIKAYPIAVSNNNGKAIIYDNPDEENNYSVTVNGYMNETNLVDAVKIEIDIITLDSFIEQNNISYIDLMKIDVETHEGEVLQGFMKYLPSFKPTFLIEILRNEVGEKVQSCLEGLGYLYFNIDEEAGVVLVDKITRRGHNYNYLLCSQETAKKLNLKF